jgi:ornithine cyclodeaminase
MKIIELTEIKEALNLARDLGDLINSQKEAFMGFSSALYDVPLPMQFIFPEFHSDCHIKGGYRQKSEYLVIKIANSGPLGNSGVLLIFESTTGELKYILRDDGFLTTLRTAIGGMIVSEIVPWPIKNIGIIGSGNLAKMLYELIEQKYPHTMTMLYARNRDKAKTITNNVCNSVEELVEKCDLVFTTTSSENPVIHNVDMRTNKVIVALGSDDAFKSELPLNLYAKCDLVIVDSKHQAKKFGDVAKAIASEIIPCTSLTELGEILRSGVPENTKTIIADFSGIGAQDVAISEFILSRLV